MAQVFVVTIEWNSPPAESTGDPGLHGVYASEEGAARARVEEQTRLAAQGVDVYSFDNIPQAFCSWCGAASPRNDKGVPQDCPCDKTDAGDEGSWCDRCGAEIDTLECMNDHGNWDVDVHVTACEVLP